jgi:hypothetical protein
MALQYVFRLYFYAPMLTPRVKLLSTHAIIVFTSPTPLAHSTITLSKVSSLIRWEPR